jgi:hypothetical protein
VINTQWETIHSMSEDCELHKMAEWVKYARTISSSNVAIEVGSFQGKTAALIAQYYPIVFAIDLYGKIEDGMGSYNAIGKINLNIMIENIKTRGLIGIVVPVVGPSTILEFFKGIDLGFIFIDGAHDYKNVKSDLLMAHEIINDKTLVVVHDYKRPGFGYPPYDENHPHHGPHDPWWGVAKAVDELIDCGMYEIFNHHKGIVALSLNIR